MKEKTYTIRQITKAIKKAFKYAGKDTWSVAYYYEEGVIDAIKKELKNIKP